MDDNQAHLMISMLGEIRGELKGLREVVQANHLSTNQRIEDLAQSNHTRFENVEDRIDKLENSHQQLLMKTAAGGGVAGGIVAATIEIVKVIAGGS